MAIMWCTGFEIGSVTENDTPIPSSLPLARTQLGHDPHPNFWAAVTVDRGGFLHVIYLGLEAKTEQAAHERLPLRLKEIFHGDFPYTLHQLIPV